MDCRMDGQENQSATNPSATSAVPPPPPKVTMALCLFCRASVGMIGEESEIGKFEWEKIVDNLFTIVGIDKQWIPDDCSRESVPICKTCHTNSWYRKTLQQRIIGWDKQNSCIPRDDLNSTFQVDASSPDSLEESDGLKELRNLIQEKILEKNLTEVMTPLPLPMPIPKEQIIQNWLSLVHPGPPESDASYLGGVVLDANIMNISVIQVGDDSSSTITSPETEQMMMGQEEYDFDLDQPLDLTVPKVGLPKLIDDYVILVHDSDKKTICTGYDFFIPQPKYRKFYNLRPQNARNEKHFPIDYSVQKAGSSEDKDGVNIQNFENDNGENQKHNIDDNEAVFVP